MQMGGMPNIPNFAPDSVDTGSDSAAQMNAVNNVPGKERMGSWSRTIARGMKIKTATTKIISTRQEFAQFLAQYGLQLLTSAVEFQQTGDFIRSSYVVYLKHNNHRETLTEFLERYPDMKQTAQTVNEHAKEAQGDMQVVTKKQWEY